MFLLNGLYLVIDDGQVFGDDLVGFDHAQIPLDRQAGPVVKARSSTTLREGGSVT